MINKHPTSEVCSAGFHFFRLSFVRLPLGVLSVCRSSERLLVIASIYLPKPCDNGTPLANMFIPIKIGMMYNSPRNFNCLSQGMVFHLIIGSFRLSSFILLVYPTVVIFTGFILSQFCLHHLVTSPIAVLAKSDRLFRTFPVIRMTRSSAYA